MLGKRLLTAVIALPVFAGALLFLPQVLWALFLLPWIAIAAWEWATLARYTSAGRAAYTTLIVASGAGLFYVMPMFVATPARTHEWIYAASGIFWFVLAPLWLKTLWTSRNALVLGAAGWLALVPMWLAL